jgi:tRNA threonylcarbamoyladenosine biosynthesis protein TsaB
MLLLALDTSSPITSVCILEDGVVRAEVLARAATPQTADHLGVIDTALQQARVTLADISLFAGTIGPGSFTGLRVGLSILKGFTADGSRPLYGISTLDALARTVGSQGLVVPCIDAKKKEVYASILENGNRIYPEGAYPPESFTAAAHDLLQGRESLWVGDGARVYHAAFVGTGRRFTTRIFDTLRPAAVAELAWEAHLRGEPAAADTLVPNYLRESEAEKNLGSKKRV